MARLLRGEVLPEEQPQEEILLYNARVARPPRNEVPPVDRPLEILHDTLTKLERLRREDPLKAEYLELWCWNRERTIELIPPLRKEIADKCALFNKGRFAGAAASVLGVTCAAAGWLLKFKNVPGGEQLLTSAKILSTTGPAVLVLSDNAEAYATKNPVNKIIEIIDNDIKFTEPLRKGDIFLNDDDVNEVKVCFEKLLQYKVSSSSSPTVIKVLNHCMDLLDDENYEMRDLIRDLRNLNVRDIGSLTIDVSNEVVEFLVRIQYKSRIVQYLRDIRKFVFETPTRFDILNLGGRVLCHRLGVVPSLESANSARLALRVGFSVILRLSTLVTEIANASCKDVIERQTKYFEELKSIENALKSELDQVKAYLNEGEVRYQNLLVELRNLRMEHQAQ